jgi:hypothetical protein
MSGGPLAAPANAVAVGTTETIIATLPVSNWNDNLGNLVFFAGVFTPPATGGSLVLKIRQGTTVTGTQVGQSATYTITASAAVAAVVSGADQSAYGLQQAQGSYVVTATYAAATGGTITGSAVLETLCTVS